MPATFMAINNCILDGLSGTGFSLWGFVLARTKPHTLKHVPLNSQKKMKRFRLRYFGGLASGSAASGS